MGFNSVLLICNDDVHRINEDPVAWWKAAWSALCGANGRLPVRFRDSSRAVWNEHADVPALILTGGNLAKVLNNHDTELTDQDIRDMKQILERHGYNIVKRRDSKKRTEVNKIMNRLLGNDE